MPVDKHHTGQEATLKIPTAQSGGNEPVEISVSDVQWDRSVTTETYNQRDNAKPTRAIREMTYVGTFEHNGKNDLLRSVLWDDLDGGDNVPSRLGTMTVIEYPSEESSLLTVRTTKFDNVIVVNESRRLSPADTSSMTYNWEAEDVTVSHGTG